MAGLHGWDWAFWFGGAAIAISVLTRLMLQRREEVLNTLLLEAERERQQRELAEAQAKRPPKKSGR